MRKICVVIIFSASLFYASKQRHSFIRPVVETRSKDSTGIKTFGYPWEVLWGQEGFIWISGTSVRISSASPMPITINQNF